MPQLEDVFCNARIVLADQVVEGSVTVRDGKIADITEDVTSGVDFGGDYLFPGLVELHTDHLEHHYKPRPGVRWNPLAAVLAHDAQVATSGITTVFDAIRVGIDDIGDTTSEDMLKLSGAIHTAVAEDRLRAEHFIHLRCEVSAPDCMTSFETYRHEPLVRMASLMDHAPGQRQFPTVEAYRNYYIGKLKLSEPELEAYYERRTRNSALHAEPNRAAIAAFCRSEGIVLASHDDATPEHIAAARAQGIKIAEFPTTIEAAEASRKAGLSILMGAPNIVRGGSHSGNVSARQLAERGLLDILSSDYIPFSPIFAAFTVGEASEEGDLPAAIALVTKNPAEAAGLRDRGEIAVGKRADLVRVSVSDGVPTVRAVWRQGQRVA